MVSLKRALVLSSGSSTLATTSSSFVVNLSLALKKAAATSASSSEILAITSFWILIFFGAVQEKAQFIEVEVYFKTSDCLPETVANKLAVNAAVDVLERYNHIFLG